jgi:SpoVK/Ycf46/Vps4 family AAA+-type ATPase
LNPGSIAAVLRIVAMNAKADKKGNLVVTQKQIEDEINIQSDVAFGTLATKIDNPFTKDDIYLNEVAAEQLERVLERIRYRSVVNESFGFGRNLPYGRGVSVVLYGPPGTGKTMLASVIANELNLPLYRVDLSQLSSKYIGETEKNVADLFAAASNSNGILFFDEADALFARRTDVSGSNDRYANAETAYLLQQVEGYDGLSILATNAMQNFDVAFKRRMTFLISIEKPNEEERIRLWNEIFPKDTPLDKNIDFKILAQKAELTGSAIKAAALDAAYRAAVRGDQVTMNDLIDAVEVQCRRNGMIGVGSSIRFGG